MQVIWFVWSEILVAFKRKFAILMKQFNATKPKYTHLLRPCALLINFLHRRRVDLSLEIIGNRLDDPEAHGWEEGYFGGRILISYM